MKPLDNWLIAGEIGHSPFLLKEQVTASVNALREQIAIQLWSNIGLVGVQRLGGKEKKSHNINTHAD